MRNGFTLIELTIVVAISGMLLALLYQTYDNVVRSRTRVASRTTYVTHMPLVYQQFARDIAGMYVPEPAIADLFAESEEQRKQSIRVDTACVLTQSDDQLSYISGITTNPLTLEHTPNRVRFVYRLVADEETQKSTLYRYQVNDLTKAPQSIIQEQRGVKLLDGITSMKVTLLAPKSEKEQQKNQNEKSQQQQAEKQSQEQEQKEKEKKPITYVEYTQWPANAQEEKPQYLIPAYARIELQGVDVNEKQFDEQYTFAISAFDGVHSVYEKQKQAAEKQKKQQQGKQQAGKTTPKAGAQAGGSVPATGQQANGQQQQAAVRRIQMPQPKPQQKRIYLVPRKQYEQAT